MASTPPVDLPVVPGEVLGWRAWDVHHLGSLVRLSSVSAQAHWPVADFTVATCRGQETCVRGGVRIPNSNCTCGIYSANSFEQLTRHLPYAQYRSSKQQKVIGQVALSGKIIEGTQGYKAERARIAHLYFPHIQWKLAQQISKQYNVEFDFLNWLG